MTTNFRKAATPSDAYRNPVLDDVSIAAFQAEDEFVSRLVFPTIGSSDQQGKYYEIDMDSIAQDKAALRAPGTESEEGAWDLSIATFLCEQVGYKEKVPEELMASTGSAAAAEEVAALSVAEVMKISDEVRFAAACFATGKWARDMAGAASNVANTSYVYWSTGAATPINDVLYERTRMKLTGKRFANTMIIGAEVEPYLLTHPTIIGRLNNGQTPGGAAQASLADLAKLFKVDRVVVAGAVYNTAKEGATASNAFILNSKSAWLGYVAPRPSIMTPSAGYRFTWEGIAGNEQGIRNWSYWDQPRRSQIVEGAIDDTFKIVAPKLGTFLSNIVQ
jgi:hypothetical protein